MLFSPADVLLWLRCRRQWLVTCYSEEGERRPAFPVEMTGEATLRETARVIAESLYRIAPGASDVHALSRGNDVGPAAADIAAVVLKPSETIQWAEATMDAISNRREFIHGLILADPVAILVDHGVYHSKLDAWEFSLFRPATGIRGVYYTEGGLAVRAADMNGVPLGALHLWYMHKSATIEGADDQAMARLYVESNILKRSQKRVERISTELQDLLATAQGKRLVDRNYQCAQRCNLCDPRPKVTATADHRFSVRTLHKGGDAVKELTRRNIHDIREIPLDLSELTDKHRIQISSVVNDSVYVNKEQLQKFLDRIEYPVFYLDFEAFATSVPFFPRLSPYGHTPVVASIHVQQAEDVEPIPYSYTASNGVDDRMAFFTWLVDVVRESGSIVVFSRPFESAMVRQLAAVAGQKELGEKIVRRMIDLLEPFAGFWTYHPDQRGKVSLKRVLPAYTDVPGYRDETVKDGMHANLGLIRRMDQYVMDGEEVIGSIKAGAAAAEGVTRTVERYLPEAVAPLPDVEEIVAYCAVDTIAMYHLIQRLHQLAGDENR